MRDGGEVVQRARRLAVVTEPARIASEAS